LGVGQPSLERIDSAKFRAARNSDDVAPGAVGRKLAELEADEERLSTSIQDAEEDDVVTMHPSAIESYLAEINRLLTAMRDVNNKEAMAIVRGLVAYITIYPRQPGEPVTFDIAGNLAALLEPSVGSVVPRGGAQQIRYFSHLERRCGEVCSMQYQRFARSPPAPFTWRSPVSMRILANGAQGREPSLPPTFWTDVHASFHSLRRSRLRTSIRSNFSSNRAAPLAPD
jgi:hypothetical protein